MSVIANCHCGGTTIELPHLPTEAGTCNCTFCARRAAPMAAYRLEQIRFISTEGDTDYAPSGMNHHHFCARCGTSTYSITPDWSLGDTAPPEARRFSINIGMFDDLDPSTVKVSQVDGRHLW